jgi:hypothetical protein
MTMTKGERAELKSVVRNQFKVLRSEVTQREAELIADARRLLTERETEEDRIRGETEFMVNQHVLECNRKINDTLREQGFEVRGTTERMWVEQPMLWGNKYSGGGTDKDRLEMQTRADIAETVKHALTHIQRQEADLLRELALGALESEDAKAFLSTIPTVSQLVPSTRLAELEAALNPEAPKK